MRLKDLVDKALSNATVKLASAQDPTEVLPGESEESALKLAMAMPGESEEDYKKRMEQEKAKKEEGEKTSSEQVVSDAQYALKVAEALDHAGGVLAKLAQPEANKANAAPGAGTSHVTAPGGMQTFQGEHMEPTKHPTHKPATVPLQQASSSGGGDEDRNDGNMTGIETNRADYSDPDWTKNKESALRTLNAKIAQSRHMESLGHIQAAAKYASDAVVEYELQYGKIAEEVQGAPAQQTAGTEVIARSGPGTPLAGSTAQVTSKTDAQRAACATHSEKKEQGAPGAKTAGVDFAAVKIAADPSSPQAGNLSTGSDFLLSTDPPAAQHVPGNEEVASMTKRDAKTKSTKKEVAPFVSEPAFSASSDPGVQANLGQGLETSKISSLQAGARRALLKKIAEKAEDEAASPEERAKAEKLRQALEAKKTEKEANLAMGY
jgi:hypothetical protein